MNHCSAWVSVCVCVSKGGQFKRFIRPAIMKFLSQVNASAVKRSEQLLLSAFINEFGMGKSELREK